MKQVLYKIVKHIITLLICLIAVNGEVNAQCAQIIASPSSANCAVSYNFNVTGTLFGTTFDFNTGGLPAGWSSTAYTVGQPCYTDMIDNSNYFWASATSGARFVQTNPLNVSGGGTIEWYMRYGSDDPRNGCEDPDWSNEGVFLQYWNGSSWVNIATWAPLSGYSGPLYSWNQYSYPIPTAAQTTSTSFRWYQPSNSGAGWDNWGLDNIEVSAAVANTTFDWDFGDGTNSNVQNPSHSYANPGTYTVTLTVGSNPNCSATVSTQVVIQPGPSLTATITDATCSDSSDGSINLMFNDATPPYTYTWTPSQGNTSSAVNLTPGTYEVIAQDATGCSISETFVVSYPELVCTGPSDLNFWSQTGDPGSGNWTVLTDGSAVFQSINGYPTFYVSPETFFNTTIEGTFSVGNSSDDDFIGFVIGFNEPSALTSFPMTGEFIVFDWKRGNQSISSGGYAASGYYLAEVDGTFTSGADIHYALWDHVDPRVNQLAAQYGNGWVHNTEYTFSIDYSATNITVRIEGVEIYNVNGTFEPGKFGFYNNSQSQVTYSGFTQEFTVGIDKTNESCIGNGDGSATANPSTFGIPPFTYSWNNGATSQTIDNLDPGIYCVTVYDSKGCDGCFAEACVDIGTDPDTELPVFQDCSVLNKNSTADPGQCGAVLTTETPTATDNCSVLVTQTGGLPSNSIFPVGVTIQEFTAEDLAGNTATCTYTVTVTDNEAPVITCPTSLVLDNDPGLCSAVIKTVEGLFKIPNRTYSALTQIVDETNTSSVITQYDLNAVSGGAWRHGFGAAQVGSTVYAVIGPNQSTRILVTIDPNTGATTTIGNTGIYVSDITADGDGTLYAISGISGPNPNSLFTLDINTGAATYVMDTPTQGAKGLAYNPDDGKLYYHDYGGLKILDPIGLTTTSITTTGVGVSGGSMTYLEPGKLLFGGWSMYLITTGGVRSNYGSNNYYSGAMVLLSTTGSPDPTVTDNCAGVTFAQTSGLPLTSAFPVGINTVIFEATDVAGNTSQCSMTVTVNDNEKPTISCPGDVAVQCIEDVPLADTLLPVADDNCTAGISVSHQGDNSDGMNCAETITRTYRVTDASNNTAECAQIITIDDTTDPLWTVAPSDKTVQCDGTPGASGQFAAWLISFSGSDICGTVTVSHNSTGLSNPCGATGSETVTFTLTDECGNAITADATFTIEDTIPPEITCPDAIDVCADQDIVTGAEVTWTEPVPTDVCGSPIFVSTHDPGDVFDVGPTTVTYTATDQCDLMSTCSFVITVYELTELYISESEMPIYCQENSKILTANIISGTGVTNYNWSTGTSGSDADTIHVQTSGTYSVTVTDINGCTRETSYDVIVIYGDLLSTYTIIGEDDVHLHGNNIVLNGGVGVMDDKGKAKIHDESFVTGPTTFVKSDKIELDNDSGIDTEILEPFDIVLPEFYMNPFDSKNDVTVDKNTTVVLTQQVYGKIDVKEGATVEFTQTDLFIKDLKTKQDVTLIFPSCAFVRIEKNLDFYKNVTVNPDGNQVQFYVDSNVEVKEGAVVNASIDARGHNMNVKGKEDAPTYMNGQYIGKKIHGEKYVTWDWATACEPGCMPSDPPPNITCECKGGMIELVIDYAGGAGANLTVNDGTITDNGDGTYTVSNGGEKLEKNFEIDDGTNLGQIHTSCSQDILGQTFAGVYTVVAHTDKYGNISTVEDCPDGVDFGPEGIEISMRSAGENTDFKVYPNPSGLGMIYVGIRGESNNDVKLVLTDILGEVMMVHNQVIYKGNNVFELDVSHLNSGTYVVKLISDSHEMTTSIILMHN